MWDKRRSDLLDAENRSSDFLGLQSLSPSLFLSVSFSLFSISNNVHYLYSRREFRLPRNFIFRCSMRSKCKLLSPFLASHRYFRFAQRDALCTCIRDSSPRYGFTVIPRRKKHSNVPNVVVPCFFIPEFSRASTLPNTLLCLYGLLFLSSTHRVEIRLLCHWNKNTSRDKNIRNL